MTTSNLNSDRAEILRVSRTLLRAVNESDVAGVRDVWAVDGTLMPPGHPVVSGIDAITRYFTDLFQRARFTFDSQTPGSKWKATWLCMDVWNTDNPRPLHIG